MSEAFSVCRLCLLCTLAVGINVGASRGGAAAPHWPGLASSASVHADKSKALNGNLRSWNGIFSSSGVGLDW